MHNEQCTILCVNVQIQYSMADPRSIETHQMKLQNWSEHKAAENVLKYLLKYIEIFADNLNLNRHVTYWLIQR